MDLSLITEEVDCLEVGDCVIGTDYNNHIVAGYYTVDAIEITLDSYACGGNDRHGRHTIIKRSLMGTGVAQEAILELASTNLFLEDRSS